MCETEERKRIRKSKMDQDEKNRFEMRKVEGGARDEINGVLLRFTLHMRFLPHTRFPLLFLSSFSSSSLSPLDLEGRASVVRACVRWNGRLSGQDRAGQDGWIGLACMFRLERIFLISCRLLFLLFLFFCDTMNK